MSTRLTVSLRLFFFLSEDDGEFSSGHMRRDYESFDGLRQKLVVYIHHLCHAQFRISRMMISFFFLR